MAKPLQDWEILQKKIFSRWCKQKLSRRPEVQCKLNDIVTDVHDSFVLIALIEELSEKKCPDKINWSKPETARIKKVAIANIALKFVFAQGVEQKLKASAEDIVDGRHENVLALVWAIMLRFIKIGDDDDDTSKLNAKDALLMWCQNKCQGYPAIPSVDSFKKSSKSPFHNGLALCAIIHKHRPKMIPNMMAMNASDPLKNIAIAQDAAEKYFGLEKFLTPTDVTKLDESSMVVYVAEFYIGISNQRKIDLAARRIDKLIKYTKENDRLRTEYAATAEAYKERLKRVEVVLNNRDIDNTMAGAERKLAEFYKYKSDDKNVLLGNQLELEALFNNLAMRLSHHKRPEFVPPAGVTLKDVEAALSHLEQVEQERSVALQAELNRQIRLAKLAEQHNSIYENLKKWCIAKEEYLKQRPIIDTVSSAQLQLKLLEAFTKEKEALVSSTIAHFKSICAELEKEKYEHIAKVKELVADIDSRCANLDEMATKRHPVLEDDLARETYKQGVRLQHKEFVRRSEVLTHQWIEPKEIYLNTWVEIHSVEEANVQLSLLDLHEKDCRMMGDSLVSDMKKLAKQVIESKYETQYSSWVFEHTITKDPEHEYQEATQRQELVDTEKLVCEKWANLDVLTAKMKDVLKDHLAREQYAAETRVIANNYNVKLKQIQHWVTESDKYLGAREHVHSVSEGTTQVTKITEFTRQLNSMNDTQVRELTAIAKDLFARKYGSELSGYVFEHATSKLPVFDVDVPQKKAEVAENEKWVANKWEEMRSAAKLKHEIMQDHLAREQYKVDTHVVASSHKNRFQDLKHWGAETMKYLEAREHIHSVSDARSQVTQLKALQQEIATSLATQVKEFQELGVELLARKYESTYSHYVYEDLSYKAPEFAEAHPEMKAEIENDEAEILKLWETMRESAILKLKIMEDHLAREEFKVETHVIASTHQSKYDEVIRWAAESNKYLKAREHIHSVQEARTHITNLQLLQKQLASMRENQVANMLKIGKELLARKYETELSYYVYEHTKYYAPAFEEHLPAMKEEIEKHEAEVLTEWDAMEKEAAEKLRIMQDHYAREEYKVETHVIAAGHNNKYEELRSWALDAEKYLETHEHVHSVAEARKHITKLIVMRQQLESMKGNQVAALLGVGKDLLGRKYETDLSMYVYEHTNYKIPEFNEELPALKAAILEHEEFITGKWCKMEKLAKEKLDVMNDHYKREEYKIETHVIANGHKHKFEDLKAWATETDKYLKEREHIHSVVEATTQITKLNLLKKQLQSIREGKVADLIKVGKELLARKHASEFSTYEYEHTNYKIPEFEEHLPEFKAEVLAHEEWVLKMWDEMDNGAIEKLKIMQDHHDRESYAVATRVIADGHNNKFNEIKSWVEASEQYLNAREHCHSVHEANTFIVQLKIFIKELAAMNETHVAQLLQIGKDLYARKYATDLSEYEYEKTMYKSPLFEEHKPELRALCEEHEKWVADKWELMAKLAQRKMTILGDHLARETFAVGVRQQGQQHADVFKKLQTWIVDKETYLKARPTIDSIGAAKVQITLYDQYVQEYKMMETSSMTGFFALGDVILKSTYNTDISSYVFDHMKYSEPVFDEDKPEIKASLEEHTQFVKQHQEEMSTLAKHLNEELINALALEEKKEALRLEYAHAALEYVKWSKETCEGLAIEVFGFTLEEVQAYKESITKSTATLTESADSKLASVIAIHTNMTETGVKENIYTQITVPNLESSHKEAVAGLTSRNAAFEKELARQIENDRLCQEFAKVAEPFSKWIVSQKAEITASKAELADQLKNVIEQINKVETDTSKLNAVRDWADKIQKAGITHIRHTTLTLKDVEVQWEQFKKFLQAKKNMLEFEIQQAKLRGITAEQFKEIDDNFKAFDKNNDSKIDTKELTACLYSLGEERTGKEIKEILKTYGDDKGCVSYENFKEFMIHVFGDADTKQEIVEGLCLINKSNPNTATHDNMEQVLAPENVTYIEQTAPKTEKGWDYVKWADVIFSK